MSKTCLYHVCHWDNFIELLLDISYKATFVFVVSFILFVLLNFNYY